MSCHSQKKLIEKPLKAQNPSFQKYFPGDGGGKGVQFFIGLSQYPETLEITNFAVNDTELPFKIAGLEDGSKLESLCFYENPERNPGAKNTIEEFEKAPLLRAKSYTAIITYQLEGISDTLRIQNFQEMESQMYP